MTGDMELREWRAEWMSLSRTCEKSPADIRRNAVRQQRRLRFWHVLELLAAIVFLAFSGMAVKRDPGLEICLWAATVWAATVAVTAFSIWNWRILWNSNLKSVSEYALEYKKICVARLRAARFGMGFLATQVAIAVPWLTWDYLRQRTSGIVFAESLAVIAGLVLGFCVVFIHHRRTATRELAEVDGSQLLTSEWRPPDPSDRT